MASSAFRSSLAQATGVPMITRCDHSADKRGRLVPQGSKERSILATFGSKRCQACIQASLIACSWVAEAVWAARALGDDQMTLLPSAEGVDAPDREAIVRVVQLYLDGFNDCDVDKFIRAFHEDAWIFFTHRDGTVYKGLVADSFEEWATPPAQRIVGRVISVTQAAILRLFFSGSTMPTTCLTGGWICTRCFASTEHGRS